MVQNIEVLFRKTLYCSRVYSYISFKKCYNTKDVLNLWIIKVVLGQRELENNSYQLILH